MKKPDKIGVEFHGFKKRRKMRPSAKVKFPQRKKSVDNTDTGLFENKLIFENGGE